MQIKNCSQGLMHHSPFKSHSLGRMPFGLSNPISNTHTCHLCLTISPLFYNFVNQTYAYFKLFVAFLWKFLMPANFWCGYQRLRRPPHILFWGGPPPPYPPLSRRPCVQVNKAEDSTEGGYLALPITTQSTNFYIASYTPRGQQSMITIVAPYDACVDVQFYNGSSQHYRMAFLSLPPGRVRYFHSTEFALAYGYPYCICIRYVWTDLLLLLLGRVAQKGRRVPSPERSV